mgnify:CR=1 FL=1
MDWIGFRTGSGGGLLLVAYRCDRAGDLGGRLGERAHQSFDRGHHHAHQHGQGLLARGQRSQTIDVLGGIHLSADRDELSEALRTLAGALGSIQGFVKDNRAAIKSNVDKLATITKVLVDERGALAETLDIAPLALSNLVNAYNASSGTLDAGRPTDDRNDAERRGA